MSFRGLRGFRVLGFQSYQARMVRFRVRVQSGVSLHQ